MNNEETEAGLFRILILTPIFYDILMIFFNEQARILSSKAE
jgi:hypothetical protein